MQYIKDNCQQYSKQSLILLNILWWKMNVLSQYSQSEWLAKQLSPLFGTISGIHIRNSSHFINVFSENSPLNHRLISFDVVSLFTKVLIDHFLEFFSAHFTEEIFQVPIGALINLLKFCLTNISFLFSMIGIYCRIPFNLKANI